MGDLQGVVVVATLALHPQEVEEVTSNMEEATVEVVEEDMAVAAVDMAVVEVAVVDTEEEMEDTVAVAGEEVVEDMVVMEGEAMVGEAVAVVDMEVTAEAVEGALVAEEVVVVALEVAEVAVAALEGAVVEADLEVAEDLVVTTGLRKCRVTTRSLCRACPLMSQKMMLPSSLAQLEQSRLIEKRESSASSSTQIATQALPRVRALSPMKTQVQHNLLSNGLTAKSSAPEDPSKLAWP